MRIIRALARNWKEAVKQVAMEDKIDLWYSKLSYEKKVAFYDNSKKINKKVNNKK
jgi:hypothetical protein